MARAANSKQVVLEGTPSSTTIGPGTVKRNYKLYRTKREKALANARKRKIYKREDNKRRREAKKTPEQREAARRRRLDKLNKRRKELAAINALNPKPKKKVVFKYGETTIRDMDKFKKEQMRKVKAGALNRSKFFELMVVKNVDEIKHLMPEPRTLEFAEVLRTAARMYGMPIPRDKTHLPLGYDKIVVIDDVQWCWPNDEAFKLLVRAKYLIPSATLARVTAWLDKALTDIGYDFRGVKGYNPERGLSPSSICRLMQNYAPTDRCVLSLDERQRLFRLEIESQFPATGSTSGRSGDEEDLQVS